MAELMDSTPAHTPLSSSSEAVEMPPPPSRSISAPEPNPSFSFPMLPPPPEGKEGERLHNRIPSPLSLPMHHHASLPSLGSGACLDPPQVSPSRAGFTHRARGHQRGGSEFIGGDGSLVGPGLMSTSPTKGEGALPSPPASVGRRRGHAHRRSGAISHHDLSAILKPKEPVPELPGRPGSVPSSPTVNHNHSLDRATSQPILKSEQASQALINAFTNTPVEDPPTPTASVPPTRPRVGFSDTLEFIPRPLSTISSETSSSISTIRPAHSASGSISSIISIGTSSPPSAKKNQYTHDVLQRYRQASPRPTYEDLVERNNSVDISPTNVKRASSPDAGAILKASNQSPRAEATASPSRVNAEEIAATNDQDTEFKELPTPWRTPPGLPTLYAKSSDSDVMVQERPRSSPETKSTRKQKTVKSWAELLLPMRTRGKMPENPSDAKQNAVPYEEFAPMREFSLEDVNFDEDTSCVINSPDYQAPASSKSPTTASNPSFAEDDEDEEAPVAVFDLDAHWEELEENDKGGSYRSTRKRTQRRPLSSTVFGTDTQYHRRTESAPALTPIGISSGLVRRANESPMADVFEEDEDEVHADQKLSEAQGTATNMELSNELEDSLAVTIVEQEPSLEKASLPSLAESSLSPQDGSDTDQRSALSQHSEVQTPRYAPDSSEIAVEIVDTVDEPRFSVITKSSDESTLTPTLSGSPPHELQHDIGLAVPFYNERHAASAPDAISFAVPHSSDGRVATMSSVHTDASTISSGKLHEVGIASSYSTEDVPSLTSSASTTASVRAANLNNAPFSRLSTERSHSFSGVTPRHPRNVSAVKRASLASLSRLVGSSYGERSKLSLEVLPMGDPERSEKKGRNRLSKLRFWKSKGKASTMA